MRDVYDYTCTGIFERHKLMFAFQMTCHPRAAFQMTFTPSSFDGNGNGDLQPGGIGCVPEGRHRSDAPPRDSPQRGWALRAGKIS